MHVQQAFLEDIETVGVKSSGQVRFVDAESQPGHKLQSIHSFENGWSLTTVDCNGGLIDALALEV